ncbi:hypothetical protein AAJ76_4000106108 [Vairimorpha ceranae]|uniref:Uncharacterized protein n=1 Tax=Vairimorpha ceranae TaxID=40302 RepID=A0A0F9WUB4_9MICR|nr:hypothetical protein AAJ76_4000106108 [Vairimorpha ceranae]KKO76353.1 hypothetical protein AAJ76_4000106108 [Vairimorpha ceranae]
MNSFETVKEYFKNIDFDIVDDSLILDNVYKEIDGYEEKLALDLETVINFELLVQKSNFLQIINLCKKINIHFLSLKKTGSKFIELIFETINIMKDLDWKLIHKFIFKPVINNFTELCVDKNATHVVRKFFIIYFCDKNIERRNFKNEFSYILKEDMSLDTLITVIHYLKFMKSKSLLRKIVRIFVNSKYTFNKLYTYIFEDLINLSDDKSLEMVYQRIKPQFIDYINDNYGVFVILALIKKYPKENDFYFSYCTKGMKNTNVLLRVTENYCKLGEYKKVKKILLNFYEIKNEVFKNLLLRSTDTPDTKHINLVVCLMNANLYGINDDFIKYYKNEWIHRKFGLTLLKGFFEGGAENACKSAFARKINVGASLHKKKEGKQLLNLIKSYKRL